MLPLTEQQIRDSFVNASRKEVSDLMFPLDFDAIQWDRLDYFGWRDRKASRRAYIVVWLDDVLVGILLQQANTMPRSRAQCSWCQEITLTNEVVFYSTKRAGQAGRKGDTLGTLMCADFGCSVNVRKHPPIAYVGFDVEAARQKRIESLGERARSFIREVLGDAALPDVALSDLTGPLAE